MLALHPRAGRVTVCRASGSLEVGFQEWGPGTKRGWPWAWTRVYREHLPVCLRTPAAHAVLRKSSGWEKRRKLICSRKLRLSSEQRRKYNDTGSPSSAVQTALTSSFQASLRTRSYILFQWPPGKALGCLASGCFWLHGMRFSTLSRRDR